MCCRVGSFVCRVWAVIASIVLVSFGSFFFGEIVIYTTNVKDCFALNFLVFDFVGTPHCFASLFSSRSLFIASRLEGLVTFVNKTLVAALAILRLRIVANFFLLYLVVGFRLLQLDNLFGKFNAWSLNLIWLFFSCISTTQLLWALVFIFSSFALLALILTKLNFLKAFGLVCIYFDWARTTFAFSFMKNTVLDWWL